MKYSASQCFAYVFLLFGTIFLLISLMTDYWSVHSTKEAYMFGDMHRGLLRQCVVSNGQEKCQNRFHSSSNYNTLKEIFKILSTNDEHGISDILKEMPFYKHKPIQQFEVFIWIGVSLSAFISILCLVLAPCICPHGICSFLIGISAVVAGLFSMLSSIWYSIETENGHTFAIEYLAGETKLHYKTESFVSWSFYLASFGCLLQFISACFYICLRPSHSDYFETAKYDIHPGIIACSESMGDSRIHVISAHNEIYGDIDLGYPSSNSPPDQPPNPPPLPKRQSIPAIRRQLNYY